MNAVTLPDGPSLPRLVQAAWRLLLRDFTLEPTSGRGERWHSRGIAYCPAKGGRAVVRRRPVGQRSRDGDHVAAAEMPA